MIVLSNIEGVEWQDGSLHFGSKIHFNGFFGCIDDILLCFVVEPDRRHVLATTNAATRVVTFPKQIDDFSKCNLSRVEVDLQCFGVISKTVICGRFLMSSGVANTGTVYAFDNPKLGFGSPESAKCECGGLQVHWYKTIDCRKGSK